MGTTPAAPGFAISTCTSNEALPSTIFPPPEIRILDCPRSDSKERKIIINLKDVAPEFYSVNNGVFPTLLNFLTMATSK